MTQRESGFCSRRGRAIVFFGSPLIDVTARIDGDFLKKFELEPDNAYPIDETLTDVFDEIRSVSSVMIGGSVTNTVRAFLKLRPRPHLVTYLGTVGNDVHGELFKNKLEGNLGENLDRTEGNTGRVVVLLCGKSRTLITDLGASRFFTLDCGKRKMIDAASYLYFSGFFIGVSYSTITEVIENTDKTLIFNLGAPFLCKKYPKEMIYIYKNSSIIVGNESEHRAFARINNVSSQKLEEAVLATANQLLGAKSRVIIVTRGGRSVLVFQDDYWSEFDVSPLNEDEIVDTSGAGDAFVGGFLARYVDGDDIANSVKCGIDIAKKVIQNVGFNLE